jgi:hypothetical protein
MARISDQRMSHHSANAEAVLVVGFGAGLVMFIKGFRVYREYRVLFDTPEMPIRSIAMGLVEIHGKAKTEQTVSSPVTKTSCCFYKVDIERWVRDKNGGHWSHAATDADGVKFHLEDGSGRVLVDAQGAEYDLLQSGKAETGRGMGVSLSRTLWGKGDPALATGPMASDADLLAYARSAVGRRRGGFSLDSGSLLPSLSGALNLGGSSRDRFRLTEYLILPDHWYDITGTCVENPAPQDEHDRNLIRKGTNEPTFLISWRSEKEIERTLRNRAALLVFGGATLSLVCLGILLAKWGWL